jgi:hypothetical protein
MEAKEFKALLGDVAKAHGFVAAHGGWYRETPAALFVLDLQKSNFGNYFELNLKLFLGRGLPSNSAELKKLVKSLSGDVFRRQPEEYREAFDLDAAITGIDRRGHLDRMFTELVDRMVSASESPAGILRLRDEGLLYLLPMAEARLKTG